MDRKTSARACALVFVVAFAAGMAYTPSAAARTPSVKAPEDSFLASDDYQDSDEIVGVFLKDPEYAKMTEDFSPNGPEFDWGWESAGLDIHQYSTVRITVKNDFGLLDPDYPKYVEQAFTMAMKQLGLKVVDGKAPADLDLGIDIVDYSSESHFAVVTMIEPFVELEIRLKSTKSGKDLLLIRNQEHNHTPKLAAMETARDLMKTLKK